MIENVLVPFIWETEIGCFDLTFLFATRNGFTKTEMLILVTLFILGLKLLQMIEGKIQKLLEVL